MPDLSSAQKALDKYRGKKDGRSDREALTDLITDLMHLADKQVASGDEDAYEGAQVIITASNNYDEERLTGDVQ
jgi:hypothetical protein